MVKSNKIVILFLGMLCCVNLITCMDNKPTKTIQKNTVQCTLCKKYFQNDYSRNRHVTHGWCDGLPRTRVKERPERKQSNKNLTRFRGTGDAVLELFQQKMGVTPEMYLKKLNSVPERLPNAYNQQGPPSVDEPKADD